MKLSEIAKMPVKKSGGNGQGCKCEAWAYYECCCGVDWNDYGWYNKGVDDCSNIEVKADVDKLAEILFEISDSNGRFPSNKTLAQEIITKMPEWLRSEE